MTTTSTSTSQPLTAAQQKWLDEMNAKQPALEAAFSRVCDKQDWKAPINWTGILTSAEAALTLEAIEHFTATRGRIRYLSEPAAEGRALVQVQADGYRLGPAH